MCRWAAWIGQPVAIDSLTSTPRHSLIAQAREAQKCKVSLNGDGFGLAWYSDLPEPCLYRSPMPAWADPNLDDLARHTHSRCILAHVRAATAGGVSYANCHPFRVGPIAFQHNGQIDGFDAIRKRADASIPDLLYAARLGSTDSECLFLLALGHGLQHDPAAALRTAVIQLSELGPMRIRLSASWSDGDTLYAARWSSDTICPSMFWQQRADGVLLASEPLDGMLADWNAPPAGSLLRTDGTRVEVEPLNLTLPRRQAA